MVSTIPSEITVDFAPVLFLELFNRIYAEHMDKKMKIKPWSRGGRRSQSCLTQTVVAIVCQHESVVAGAPVVARYVDAVVNAAAVVVVLALIRVWRRKTARFS